MGYRANITSNLINQVVRLVLGVITSVLVARALGPSGQGYAAYILLVFTLLGGFGHLGLNNAVMYFRKRQGIDPAKLHNVNLTALGVLALLIAVLVIGLRITGLVLVDYGPVFVLAGLLMVAADFTYINENAWFISDERIKQSNRYNITVFLIKSGVILLLWSTGSLTPLSFFLTTALALAANAAYVHLRLGMGFRPAWDWHLLRSEFRYGGIIYFASGFAFLHYRVDQFMIRQIMDTASLGIYTVAMNLAELLFLIPVSITTALTGRLYNVDTPDECKQITAITARTTLYVCGGLAIIGIPASLLIPVVYGPAYYGAVHPTMILLAGVAFASVARVAAPYYLTSGKPGIHLMITFFTLLLNVGLNLWFIPLWGIAGAAWASSISYLLYGLYYVLMFIFRERIPPGKLFALKLADIKALLERK
jgi:O-antigen/teichoic acid export membrane protein